MPVLPVAFVLTDHIIHPQVSLMMFIGKGLVFFGAGARLGQPGARQLVRPRFTAHEIFHMRCDDALPLVREWTWPT
jgi:aminopeptidase N